MCEGYVRLDRLRDELRTVIAKLKKYRPGAHPGRIHTNISLIQELLDHMGGNGRASRASVVQDRAWQRKLVWAVTETYQIILIDRWLDETENTGLHEKFYKWLTKGGAVAREESGKRVAKGKENLCYQLAFAALLHCAGCRDLIVKEQGNPDMAGIWRNKRVIVECKNVTGPGSVSSEAKAANGQLTNGDIRIIAMDVSGAIHRDEFWARDWGDLEIQGAVHEKLWDICEEQEDEQQQSEIDNPNGLLVEATIPYQAVGLSLPAARRLEASSLGGRNRARGV